MSNPSILIVEDEAIVSADIANKLRKLGYEVAGTTGTGEEAIEIARRQRPSLVLMDIRLAGAMDGIAAADVIRQECQVPVIFLTAHSDKATIQRAKLAEAFGYILKPFDDRELHTQIEMALYRHATEQRLRESQARLATFAAATFEGIIEIEAGRIVDCNEQFARILGYMWADMRGMEIATLIAPEDIDRVTANIQREVESVTEHDMLRKDGTRVVVEAHCRPLYPGRCIIAIRDITDYKRSEAQKAKLEAQNQQLQKAESLGRMAGAIAHHFNNQLHAVMGNLEMAMDGLPLGVNPIENLASAMQAARKAAEVGDLMLTYLGQKPGKHEPIDLSEACRQILPLLRNTAPKGTLLNADFSSIGLVIRANAGQIMQVLNNLVANAWESADENRGCIDLTVKTVSQATILALKRFPIDWQPRDPVYACLEVADAGCGIAEKDFEKIFDPFFSTKFTGRGLGLSVVLGIVRAHHGAVAVESEPGRGSIFRVIFPVSVEEVPRHPDKVAQTAEMEEGGTALLVEAEDHVRSMIKTMLKRMGFTVLEARDGIEAVEVFRQHLDEIRCVVCDLTMPRMDGWETLAALRGLSPGIPFVLTSGYDKEHVIAGDHTEWPQAFLKKPYQFKELSDSIRQSLQNKRRENTDEVNDV
ncbi:MAG: response regulator [Deltaproteobacteria bacterium]|nr:response regulator [Deltaproteobacteria bacterium]